jgi:outer membrane protein assembly factor BamA
MLLPAAILLTAAFWTPAQAQSTDEATASAAPTATPTPTPTPQGFGSGLAGRIRTRERKAPLRENQTLIDLTTKHFSAVVGGMQQGAGFDFGVEATTADLIPGIELRAQALTSTRFYRRFEATAYAPKIGDHKTHGEVWFSYQRRTRDNFFGIGSLYPKTEETNYDVESRSYNAALYREFTPRLQAGIYAQVANSNAFRGEDDKDIPVDVLYSGNPATVPPARWLPGLYSTAKIFSYGVFAEYDRRNNDRGLTRGAYLYGRVGSADGLKNDNAFSDYGWVFGELDARGYVPLGSDKTSLAVRGYSLLQSAKGGSQIPFYDQAYLGGRSLVRGFQNFRFRGNNVVAFSAELRQTVLGQEENRGVDVFAFGDTGQVWGDNRSRLNPATAVNRDFDGRNWRAGIGGGVQYRYSKGLAARVEIGHSNERNLIYLSVSRGF